MTWLRIVNVFALLFGLALALTVSPVWAQDDMGGDAQDPPAAPQEEEPQEAPQEGDTNSDDDIDTTPSPATTVAEAFEAALTAMKDRDGTALAHLIPLDDREQWNAETIQEFLDCLTIKSCAAGEVTVNESTDDEGTVTKTTTGTYTWECVVDADSMAAFFSSMMRARLEQDGLEGEELDAELAKGDERMKEYTPVFKAHLEKSSHTMTFVQGDDERWYMDEPFEDPEMPEGEEGGEGSDDSDDGEADEGDGDSDAATYACPMASHADQTSSDADASCPKCGMAMRLVETDDGDDD